jgi:hypothetical protein
MHRAIALSLVLCLLLLAACELPDQERPEEGDMFAINGLKVIDQEVLWEIVILEVSRSGFQIDRNLTNKNTGEIETKWRMELAPFRYEGRRRKILGVIREQPEGSGTFSVRLTVWTQRNADIENPMDPGKAIWQDTQPDKSTVDDLMYRIQGHFPDFEPKKGGDESGE